MIRVPGEDRHHPVDLLRHEDADKLMGESRCTEGECLAAVKKILRQPVRAAHNKCKGRHATIARRPDCLREHGARSRAATLIKDDYVCSGWQFAPDQRGFIPAALVDVACAAFVGFYDRYSSYTDTAPRGMRPVDIAIE